MAVKIFLIGPIPKGDDVRDGWKDWKKEFKKKLSTIPGVEFTDGEVWRDETKPLQLMGHDAHSVKTADIIIVNAEKKVGAGSALEMAVAKYFSRPVISVIPKDTHHRRSGIVFDSTRIDDWIHPFLLAFSDLVVEDIGDCIAWIKEFGKNPESKKIKDITIIDKAIDAFLEEK